MTKSLNLVTLLLVLLHATRLRLESTRVPREGERTLEDFPPSQSDGEHDSAEDESQLVSYGD